MIEELQEHARRRKSWRGACQKVLKWAPGYIIFRHGGLYVYRPAIAERYRMWGKKR